MIYHLAWRSDWQGATGEGRYRPASLATEGFIHCTKEPGQVAAVADQFFAPREGDELLLVAIDETALDVAVLDEEVAAGQFFPHVYGPLPLLAVRSIVRMARTESGWALPAVRPPGNR